MNPFLRFHHRVTTLFLIGYFVSGFLMALAETSEKRPAEWEAEWIFTHQWGRESSVYDPVNLFVIFRKTFQLSEDIEEAQAYIFADPRYRLFINNEPVGRGPVRSEAYWFYYDSYDVRPFLKKGKNAISVLINTIGDKGLGWYIPPPHSPVRGALLFQAELTLSGGRELKIVSDSSWKFHQHEGWLQDTPRVNSAVPHMEVYDARLELPGWKSADLDDAAWRQAVVLTNTHGLSGPGMEPYIHLLPRSIPPLAEEEVWPQEVVGVGETESEVTSMADLAERMAEEAHYSLQNYEISGLESVASEGFLTIERKEASVIQPRAPYVILDFGRQLVGYLRFEIDAPAGTMIDIAFTEEVKEGNVDATTPSGEYVARYTAREGFQLWERFDWYGFRFVQLTFRNFSRAIRVRTSLNFTTFPPGKGAFECSDPLLNSIWKTARHTLRLGTWDRFLDVQNREQRQWLGDGQLELMAHYALNGDLSIVRKFLRDGARSQRSDGLLKAFTGAHPESYLPDYNFSWIDSLADYYLYSGDMELVRELYPSLIKCLAWFSYQAGADGLLGSVPYWIFLDFSGPDRRGKVSTLNARYYYSLKRAIWLADTLGDDYYSGLWSAAASRLKESFDDHFWDERRGVYVDAWVNGEKSPYLGQLANGMAILSGLAPQDQIERILEVIYDPQRVQVCSQGGARYRNRVDPPPRPDNFDITTDVAKPQPHGFHFVMRALDKLGLYDLQISEIKERWGSLVNQGATAFWGNWDRGNTLAAGWASTPAFHFATTILGIRPIEPGFSLFAVEPRTVGLDWAKGLFPAIKGAIPVSWETEGSEFRLEGEIPEDTQAEILLPKKGEDQPHEVVLNGTRIWRSGKASSNKAIQWIRQEDDGVRLRLTKSGRYELRALY